MSFGKDSRERRRRQNRESQQRRRQRQKQLSGVDVSNDTTSTAYRILATGQVLAPAPLTGRPAFPPQPQPQALCSQADPVQDYNFGRDASFWDPSQMESNVLASSFWPPLDTNVPMTGPDPDVRSNVDVDADVQDHGRQWSNNRVAEASPQLDNQASSSAISSVTMINSPSSGGASLNLGEIIATSANPRRCTVISPAGAADAESTTRQDTRPPTAAEKAIKDVQVLYTLGVKVGFLRKSDRVRNYLASMKRKYGKIPSLRDEDCNSSSNEDSSGLSDEDSE